MNGPLAAEVMVWCLDRGGPSVRETSAFCGAFVVVFRHGVVKCGSGIDSLEN